MGRSFLVEEGSIEWRRAGESFLVEEGLLWGGLAGGGGDDESYLRGWVLPC